MSEQSTLGDVLLGIEAGKSFQTTEVLAREHEMGVLKVSAVTWSAFRPDQAKVVIGYEPDERHRVRAGDLLISRANTRELVGAVVVVDKDYPQRILSDKTLRLVVDPQRADKSFLLYALRSATARAHIEEFATGSSDSMRNIGQSVITSIPLVLPPLEEQQRIAARLKSQLAAVEEARQAAQAQLGEFIRLKTSAIEGIFSSLTEGRRIGDVARLQSGYAFKSQAFQKNGIRLLRNANILPGMVYWDESVFLTPEDKDNYADYDLNDGDILISLDRPIISSGIKVARVSCQDLPALLVQRVGRFILNQSRVDANYLHLFLQSARFISAISGHDQSLGVPHISPRQVEDVVMPCPDLIEQKRIAGLLADILCVVRDGVHAVEKQINEIKLLPARLLAQEFGLVELPV